MLSSAEDAPEIAPAKTLGIAELERRAQVLQSDSEFLERLIATFESTKAIRQPSPHVEEQLYDAFFTDIDQNLLDEFHDVPWEERISIIDKFKDERLRLIGQQLIHMERPDILNGKLRRELDIALAKRILGYGGDVPWLTLSQALQELTDLVGTVDGSEAAFVRDHRAYISERLKGTKALL